MSVSNRRISDSYGDILSTSDVVTLFSGLMERKGGKRAPAAELCNLTPATTYSWESGVKYIKTDNKKKVLRACLDVDYEFALELVLNSMYERTVDVSIRLLREYFELLLDSTRDDFLILSNNYTKIKCNYIGIFNQEYYEETSDMRKEIIKKSQELNLTIPKRNINEVSNEELLQLFSKLLKLCLDSSKTMEDIEQQLPPDIILPTSFIENISKYK